MDFRPGLPTIGETGTSAKRVHWFFLSFQLSLEVQVTTWWNYIQEFLNIQHLLLKIFLIICRERVSGGPGRGDNPETGKEPSKTGKQVRFSG
jgi:hypothetical protein